MGAGPSTFASSTASRAPSSAGTPKTLLTPVRETATAIFTVGCNSSSARTAVGAGAAAFAHPALHPAMHGFPSASILALVRCWRSLLNRTCAFFDFGAAFVVLRVDRLTRLDIDVALAGPVEGRVTVWASKAVPWC